MSIICSFDIYQSVHNHSTIFLIMRSMLTKLKSLTVVLE